MDIIYKVADIEHLNWLAQNDEHINLEALSKKIKDQQIFIAQHQNEIIAWLRFNLFWDSIPFINMLIVLEEHRGKGIGSGIVAYWEEQMRTSYSSTVLMTSSQSNESGQHFFRKIGYKDAGNLLLPKEPLEIIFIKEFVYT